MLGCKEKDRKTLLRKREKFWQPKEVLLSILMALLLPTIAVSRTTNMRPCGNYGSVMVEVIPMCCKVLRIGVGSLRIKSNSALDVLVLWRKLLPACAHAEEICRLRGGYRPSSSRVCVRLHPLGHVQRRYSARRHRRPCRQVEGADAENMERKRNMLCFQGSCRSIQACNENPGAQAASARCSIYGDCVSHSLRAAALCGYSHSPTALPRISLLLKVYTGKARNLKKGIDNRTFMMYNTFR